MQASIGAGNLDVVSKNEISDLIKNLGVISCDICGKEKASFDVFVRGVVADVAVLKRCCDKCASSFG
jgi:hypothetical protein